MFLTSHLSFDNHSVFLYLNLHFKSIFGLMLQPFTDILRLKTFHPFGSVNTGRNIGRQRHLTSTKSLWQWTFDENMK